MKEGNLNRHLDVGKDSLIPRPFVGETNSLHEAREKSEEDWPGGSKQKEDGKLHRTPRHGEEGRRIEVAMGGCKV